MKILSKLFGKEDNQKLMDDSPCLAPWYFTKDNPTLVRGNKVLTWKAIGSSGIMSLIDAEGNTYVLLNMGCYILPSKDNKSFLIWDRDLAETVGLQAIKIFYYELDKLQPIVGRDRVISQIENEKKEFYFSGDPTAKLEFAFNPREDAMKFDFPNEFKQFGEFIFLTELDNLYDQPDNQTYWHNTTMLLIRADTGWVFNYPQDWFNKSNCDFGYQWITRAIRNPKTNFIHGQGIRLDDFVLDDTNRQRLDKE
jgi:hypothetical protein